jgi:hypothetical protein
VDLVDWWNKLGWWNWSIDWWNELGWWAVLDDCMAVAETKNLYFALLYYM